MGTKKTPIAPNVPVKFIAQKTEGFSGADLAELMQRACKAAIRDSIAADELAAAGANIVIEGSQIGRKHMEEAFGGARRSVTMTDLGKYDTFRQKYDPVYKTQSGGKGFVIDWPENGQSVQSSKVLFDMNDEDDLY